MIPYPEDVDTGGEILISNYDNQISELRPFETMMIYRK